ncbi:hypothetical protein DICPUDRAFT_76180 [Dictyostelium purpureum]|uniref:TRAF-type domain-containing protein n=1 Tax=Dictyostelium purpureum TaxID=5786 RepID=F0ZCU8_DICPU|nr:uncharacterized protein DICPUDRAFT_76180 [Dictyostelium purpureum]EGC38222.1 hypothetical protein DICPUDRAFT_76180 [Dictyostelium purpureum]|eukprot:XP_003285260.1 hypothetical protein DICPUDRAFT_76180 [Dictyostelium purpureum]
MENNSYPYDELLVNKDVDSDYCCPLCTLLLSVNLQCREGHVFCVSCWNKQLENKKECVMCRCEVKSIACLSKNRFLEKEIRKLNIYCPNRFLKDKDCNDCLIEDENGCKSIITIDQIDSHLKSCLYNYVNCSNPGCGEEHRANTVGEHEKVCKYQIVSCLLCNDNNIQRKDLKYHYDCICSKTKTHCKCCSTLIERGQLPQHMAEECGNVLIPCRYKDGGCDKYIPRCELSKHLIEEDNHHKYILNIIEQHKSRMDQLASSINSMKLNFENQNRYSGKWIISNWSEKLQQFPAKKFLPLSFNLSPMKPFSIRLYPNGTNAMWGNITISLVKEFIIESKIKFSFEIENVDLSKSEEQVKVDTFKCLNDSWSLQFFGTYDSNNGFIRDNSITINFTIIVEKCYENCFITE